MEKEESWSLVLLCSLFNSSPALLKAPYQFPPQFPSKLLRGLESIQLYFFFQKEISMTWLYFIVLRLFRMFILR